MENKMDKQTFIDPEIKSIEVDYIMGYVVSITWNNDERKSVIRFNKQKDAVNYYNWLKGITK